MFENSLSLRTWLLSSHSIWTGVDFWCKHLVVVVLFPMWFAPRHCANNSNECHTRQQRLNLWYFAFRCWPLWRARAGLTIATTNSITATRTTIIGGTTARSTHIGATIDVTKSITIKKSSFTHHHAGCAILHTTHGLSQVQSTATQNMPTSTKQLRALRPIRRHKTFHHWSRSSG